MSPVRRTAIEDVRPGGGVHRQGERQNHGPICRPQANLLTDPRELLLSLESFGTRDPICFMFDPVSFNQSKMGMERRVLIPTGLHNPLFAASEAIRASLTFFSICCISASRPLAGCSLTESRQKTSALSTNQANHMYQAHQRVQTENLSIGKTDTRATRRVCKLVQNKHL